MKNLFCVISAIGNNYGAYTYNERYAQLLETIKSIRQYAPGNDIWLYDSSEVDIPETDKQNLCKLTEKFVTLKNHPEILAQSYRTNSDNNLTGKKSVGEVTAFTTFLQDLHRSELEYNRVYKLAGRWRLNSNFNINDHDAAVNSVVFRTHEFWGHEEIYRIRLWSFDFKLLVKLLGMFVMIYDYTFNKVYYQNLIPTLERTMYTFIQSQFVSVVELQQLGVEGYFGQNAVYLSE